MTSNSKDLLVNGPNRRFQRGRCGLTSQFELPASPLRSVSARIVDFRANLSIQYQQISACHPQVRQREQRRQLRRVLLQPAIALLHVSELALHDTEGMSDLGTDARLDLFDPLDECPRQTAVAHADPVAHAA